MAISRMQEPRQLYGLGSLVKKAVRGVKKIVKSPLGKAALIGGLGFGLNKFGPTAGWFGKMTQGKGFSGLGSLIKRGAGSAFNWAKANPGKASFLGLGATALAAPFFMKGDDEEEVVEEAWDQVPSSIANIRNQARNYYTDPASSTLSFMPGKQFVNQNFYAADGGRAERQGFFEGALADTKEGKAMSPGTSASGGTDTGGYGRDDVPLGNNSVTDVPPDNLVAGLTEFQKTMLNQRKSMIDSIGYQGILDTISSEDDPEDPATLEDVQNYYSGTYVGAQGGRVGLLNGGGAGEKQIEQMLMAEFVKYKNQGGTLSFEEFVQAVMQQQQEGQGMEQPQEVAMAADGGRMGYAGGQLVTPSADGSRPGYRGLNIGITPGPDDRRRPPRNKFDFLYTTGPLNDEQKDILQNMTEEDWKEADKGGFVDIIIDILKTPFVIRGGETDEPLFSYANGGRIGAYAGGLMSEDEDEYAYNPQAAMRMYRRPGKQEGGIMETEVAEEMIDLGGQEKDYRETGGFVDLGGEERG